MSSGFQTAFLSCLFHDFSSVHYRHGRGSWTLDEQSVRISKRGAHLPGRVRIRLAKSSRAQKNETFGLLELQDSLAYCPVEIKVNDRPISKRVARSETDIIGLTLTGPVDLLPWGVASLWEDHSRHKPVARMCPINDHWGRDRSAPKSKFQSSAEIKFFQSEPLGVDGKFQSGECLLACLMVGAKPDKGGIIDIVQNGVVIESLEWPHSGQVNGVVSGMGLDTDISGLNVVKNKKLSKLFFYLKDLLEEASLRSFRANYLTKPYPESES